MTWQAGLIDNAGSLITGKELEMKKKFQWQLDDSAIFIFMLNSSQQISSTDPTLLPFREMKVEEMVVVVGHLILLRSPVCYVIWSGQVKKGEEELMLSLMTCIFLCLPNHLGQHRVEEFDGSVGRSVVCG